MLTFERRRMITVCAWECQRKARMKDESRATLSFHYLWEFQKRIAPLPTSESSATFDPYKSPKQFRGTGNSACTHKGCQYLYPEACLAVSHLRSALQTHFHEPSRSPVKVYAVPFGFCCGGFSSTAGYVPGNEAQTRKLERLRHFKIDRFSKRNPFLSGPHEKALQPSPAKPFGFSVGRE